MLLARTAMLLGVVLSIDLWGGESEPIPNPQLFVLTTHALRSPALPQPTASANGNAPVQVELTNERAVQIELAEQRYEAMSGRPLLSVTAPAEEQGGAYGFIKAKVLDPITNPEVIRLRKVQITGGLVGAVKHKNPFYLLNPLIFAVDW